MLSKELMIGDYVSVLARFLKVVEDGRVTSATYELGRKVCRVRGIGDNGNTINIGNTCSELISLDPIPLTDDLLTANGWSVKERDFDGNNWYAHDMAHFYVATNTSVYTQGFELEYLIGDDAYLVCHCGSVHELQHALRLCGLNYMADNFKVE